MKIYPSCHEISASKSPDINQDIPLAYINYDFYDITLSHEVNENLISEYASLVYPYKKYDNINVNLYKNKTTKLSGAKYLKRIEDAYHYVPDNMIEFIPETFSFEVYAKRNINYLKNKMYNIDIGCIAATDETAINKNLIKIFSDINNLYSPHNIVINNNDSSLEILTGKNPDECNTMIIETTNSETIKGTIETIDLDIYYKNCTNLWISIDSNPNMLEENSKDTYLLKSPIYNTNLLCKSSYNIINSYFDENTFENISYLFFEDINNCPIAVLRNKTNKGIIVYSHRSIFDNIYDNAKCIYEILSYIYMNSYIKSNTDISYICDNKPDFYINNNGLQPLDYIKSNKKYIDYFSNDIAYYDTNGIELIDIKTSNENIVASSILNEYIIFKRKDNIIKDPIKNEDQISLVTEKDTIIFVEKEIYEVQNNLNNCISYYLNNNYINIIIKNYKSSIYGIDIEKPLSLNIPLEKVYNGEIEYITSGFFNIYILDNVIEYTYNEECPSNSVFLFKINVYQEKSEPKIFDLRKKGGGSDTKNYNLLNYSNSNGRPYRKGGTMIITLPKKYEKYKDILTSEINKYKTAEGYFVLLFEEEE